MIKQRQLSIALFFLSMLSILLFGRQQACAGDPHEDFWWDYGEADEKHATFAPAMDKEIQRKTVVDVFTPQKPEFFIADESLQIRYLIRVPFDVRIDEKMLPEKLEPFEIANFHFGPRTAIKSERDIEQQDLVLTVRLDESSPYGTYTLPSFDLHYQYDTIAGNKRIPMKGNVATGEIFLEKVPAYVRVKQQRNTGLIGDVFPCFVELHADNSVLFPNLNQKSDADPLQQFKPGYPFMIRKTRRTEFTSEHYRVLRYVFMVVVQSNSDQHFTLAFPDIAWQQTGALSGHESILTPAPLFFFIKKISDSTTGAAPLKKQLPEPPGDRDFLLVLPLRSLIVMFVLTLFWFLLLFRQHQRQREKIAQTAEISWQQQPVYDKWPWKSFVLWFLVMAARREFQKDPTRQNCANLRNLLARNLAMRLSIENRLSIEQACALTAGELIQLGCRKEDIEEIQQLDDQLESDRYERLPGQPVVNENGFSAS